MAVMSFDDKKIIRMIGGLEIFKATIGLLWVWLGVFWVNSPYQFYLSVLCLVKMIIGYGLLKLNPLARKGFIMFMAWLFWNAIYFDRVFDLSLLIRIGLFGGSVVAILLAIFFILDPVKKAFLKD